MTASEPRRFPLPRLAGAFALATVLGGCAGTRVADLSQQAPAGAIQRPHSVSIAVIDSSPVPKRASRLAGHDSDVREVRAELGHDLAQLLAARDLVVVAAGRPADIDLRCAVTDVRGGSAVARLLVGYGAGKAVLKLSNTVSAPGTASPLLSFSTIGTTGAMPGAGLGLASAAGAAGTAVHMIGPALGIPGTLRQGLAQEAQQATTRIDDRIAAYFAIRGWAYPRPAGSVWDRL